jgi:Potential Queuosine, Q, salvage protein family
MDELRAACAIVAGRATHVTIVTEAIPTVYRVDRPVAHPGEPAEPADPADPAARAGREELAARWLTLNAINYGSGWFPTLRKRPGLSGSSTIAAGLSERFDSVGPWTAAQLAELDSVRLGPILDQEPEHELMALYATSLRDLGERVASQYGGRFTAVTDAAAGSAVALARRLGGWDCFEDRSRYRDLELPFLKRAQLAAADLHRAGAARFGDVARLTMFADNLVPHVLRLDGVLRFSPELVARIERHELIEHGSPEEVEIRACAVHAVELLVDAGAAANAAELDQALWQRGQRPRYKASPRHRTRCTAY